MAEKLPLFNEVKCIKSVWTVHKGLVIEKDSICYLDINSIYGDEDGDWYGVIYDSNKAKQLGIIKLNHFRSA